MGEIKRSNLVGKDLQKELERQYNNLLSKVETEKLNTPLVLNRGQIRKFFNMFAEEYLSKGRARSILSKKSFTPVRLKNSYREAELVFVEEDKAKEFLKAEELLKKSVRFSSIEAAQAFADRTLGEIRDLRGMPESKSNFKVVFIKHNPMAIKSWVNRITNREIVV